MHVTIVSNLFSEVDALHGRRSAESFCFYVLMVFCFQKWTPFLDEVLTKAVRKHGEGNWKRMLLDHDYNGRMGVMLKDRWRILKRDTVA